MISMHSGQRLASVLRDSSWSTPIMLLLGLTGALLGNVYWESGPITVCMFLVPVLVMHVTLAFYSRKSRQAIQTLQAANEKVEQAHQEKEQTLHQMIATIGAIIDARDNAIAGHSERVAAYAVALGRELGLTPAELDHVRTAGLLHDLGKVAVPEAILHKPTRLTDEEYAIIKGHAATGERILAEVQPLAEMARMVGDHHERFDGGGYPHGERGTAITTGGRIVAVADTLDSILSDRPYSKGRPLAWALDELDRCAGTHFDPAVVAALHRVVATLGQEFFSRMTYANDAPVPGAVSPQEALEAALAAIAAA